MIVNKRVEEHPTTRVWTFFNTPAFQSASLVRRLVFDFNAAEFSGSIRRRRNTRRWGKTRAANEKELMEMRQLLSQEEHAALARFRILGH